MGNKKLLLILIVIALTACQKSVGENISLPIPQSSPVTAPTPTSTPYQGSLIQKIDFKNFTYTGPDDYADTFTLINGERPMIHGKVDGISLSQVVYSDLTGDGEDDAIISMFVQNNGTAKYSLVFIYTLKNKRPKLIWCFKSGDRAVGGLKDIATENGALIVEFYGISKLDNGQWSFDILENKYRGDGVRTMYTRNRIKWNGKMFVSDGEPESYDIQ